ncbi:Flp pilus assembly protein CpaB [Erythrobacter ani]|uniref:Flp pilus assembly protein CpaB n=1 Tax=Erythrobacter ani TaxID=2827235 RepID=A0ABS6SMZ2_9SPHN|nr:Flp pilus assembly protein CpaB [Erythrobacter ani]
MNRRNLIVLAIAVAIGIFAVILANAYFTGVEERQEAIAQEQQLSRIVVATQPLEFGSPLTAENIRLQNFPASSVPQGAFRTIEGTLDGGRVALRPIVPGEPVLASKVSGSGGRAVLSANLPEGMRAVSVAVTEVTGVAGFARPGDVVDVILTRQIPGPGADASDLMTDVIMERVPLLGINQIASENATEPTVGKTATLQVDLFQAQKLALATRLGTLSLALRNVENDAAQAALTVTARDLGGRNLYIPARNEGSGPIAQAQFTPSAPRAAAAPARPRGPTMTIIRGTEGEDYPVDRAGGR